MPFKFGPVVPQQVEPEDDEQQVPTQVPDFVFDLFPAQTEAARAASPLAQQTREVSGALAASLVGGIVQPQGQVQAAESTAVTPAPTRASIGAAPLSFVDNLKIGIQEGKELALVGMGTSIESIAEFFNSGVTPETSGRRAVQLMTTAEEFGRELRQQSGEDLARLAQTQPANFVQEAVRITAQMTPLIAAGTVAALGAGVAGGSAVIAGLTAAFGTAFPTEKGILQNELEQAGLTAEEADLWSTGAAVPIAMLEMALPGRQARAVGEIVSKAVPGVVRRDFVQAVTEVAKEAGVSAVTEGLTEGFQEVMSASAAGIAVDDELPSVQELAAKFAESARAGAIGGVVFGGGFGAVGEVANTQRVREAEEADIAARAEVRNFNPDAAEDGTIVGGKRLKIASNGQRMWFDAETNKLVKKPTAEALEEELLGNITDAGMEAQVAASVAHTQQMEVPIPQASAQIASLTERDIAPEAVELNVRNIAANYLTRAGGLVFQRSEAEIDNQIAVLEAIALDPTNGADHATRVTAMARKRALEFRQRTPGTDNPESLNITVGAQTLAALDAEDFNSLAASFSAGQNPIQLRVLQEAQSLRAADLVDSANDQVNSLLSGATERSVRGIASGTKVTTPDGEVANVIGIRPSGFLDVMVEGSTEPAVVDPAGVGIIPKVGQTAQLSTGQVVDVLEVTDDGVRVRLPDDTQAVIGLSEVERVGAQSAMKTDLAVQQQVQKEEAGVEVRQELPQSIQAIDSRSGAAIEITEAGASTVALASGDVLARNDVAFPGADRTVSAIRETGVIPVFEPGTQPSAPGRHINFLRIPEEFVEQFKGAVRNSDVSMSAFLGSLPRGGGMFLLPQPPQPGMRTFAIELPADARTLTDASKKVLGFLGGKNVSLKPASLQGRVRISRPVDAGEIGVMSVPQALLNPVVGGKIVNQNFPGLNAKEIDEQIRQYIRRLTDLGFGVDAKVGQVYTAATQAAQVAADARIDGRLGEAEVQEIEAQTARTEAFQVAIDQETQERREVWDTVKVQLAEFMTPQEQASVDALDVSTPTSPEALRGLLESMPGRKGTQSNNWLPVFEHPEAPGMHLVIDKETIQTAEDIPGISVGTLQETLGEEAFTALSEEDLESLTARGDLAERDLYHIRFITPDKMEIKARTIGTDMETFKVPAHLAIGSVGAGGFASTPPAFQRINEGVREGRTTSELIDELQGERRDVQKLKVIGLEEPVTVLQEDAETIIVQTRDGERMEIAESDIEKRLGSTPENLVPLTIPRRLSSDEVLDEVVKETRVFNKKAGVLAVGEWHSKDIPGVYGEVREAGLEFQAILMEESQDRHMRSLRVKDVQNIRSFASREAAESWLESLDFSKSRTGSDLGGQFQSLPAVESLLTAPAEPGGWDMRKVELHLSDILRQYHKEGFIPQPVRDYSVRFALRWNQMKQTRFAEDGSPLKGSLFGGRSIRRMLGVFEVQDAQAAARFGMEEGRVGNTSPDVTFEGGNVVVEQRTPQELADDVRVLDGILLDPGLAPTDPARVEQMKQVFESAENRDRFLDLIESDGDPSVLRIGDRLVEVGPEKRLGVVMDSRPGSDEILVQTLKGAEPTVSTMMKKDVTRVRNPEKSLDYYRAAKDALGELTNLPRTPEMGASPLDAKLGLGLIQDRDGYIEALGDRIEEISEFVSVGKDGNINGDTKHVGNLMNAWIRMKELGISQRDLPVDQNVPISLVPLLNDLAYEEIASTFSNISPYGDVMAKAKLGLLGKRKEKQIAQQAKDFNIDPTLPTYRKVEELMQNVWDPQAAHLLYQIRRETGFLRFIRDGNMPEQGIELRAPDMGSIVHTSWAGAPFTFPRAMATRHPTARVMIFMAEKARTLHGGRVKRGRDIIQGLQSLHGLTGDRKKVVMGLLRSEALGDAMARPSDILTEEQILSTLNESERVGLAGDWDWYRQYKNLRQLLVEGRRDNIRNALFRGFHPTEINSETETKEGKVDLQRKLGQSLNLTANERAEMRALAEAGEKVYDLDRVSNPAFAKPQSEINTFLDLTDEYASLEEIPDAVKTQMAQSQDGWMVDEFDFWARFGINNYVPIVLQGHHKILMELPDGGNQIVGFAPNGQQAQEFAFRVSRGQLDGIPSSAKLYFEVGKAIVDDIDVQFLGPRFSQWYARTAKVLSGKDGMGAKLMREGVRALRVGRERAAPRDLHTQARTGELTDNFEDPYESLLYYWSRTSRNNFLLDIEHGYETARGLDADLARAEGLDAAFPDQRTGQGGQGPLAWYLGNLRDSFTGRQNLADKVINRFIALINSPIKMSKKAVGQFEQKMQDPDYDIFSDPTFLDGLYDEDFAARRFAESATSLQSLMKLGFNMGSAVINAGQHLSYTPAYLMLRGMTLGDATKFSLQGYQDALDFWKGSRADQKTLIGQDVAVDPEQQALVDFVRDAGTVDVPAKGTAGGSLDITGERSPLFFSDDKILNKGGRALAWAAMLPFATAERSVRLASTFAAKRAAEALGLDYGASVAFARDVVDNTQFQYYDQAMPPFMRGNMARVMFQFTQFIANALKFGKDLALGSLPANFPLARAGRVGGNLTVTSASGEKLSAAGQARKASLLFGVTGFALGGGAWVANRPLISAIGWLWRTFATGGDENPEELLMNAFGGAEEREARNVSTNIGDPEFFKVRNFLLYGAPGLLDLQLSARWGVSGLELDPSKGADLALGPTGSLFKDTYDLFKGPGGFATVNPKATMLGLGVGVLSQMKLNYPMSLVGNTLIATALASRASGVPLDEFFSTNSAGRQYLNSQTGPVGRGVAATIDMFGGDEEFGVTRDARFQEKRYTTSLNVTFELMSKWMGFQTVRDAEERSYFNYYLKDQESRAEGRNAFIERGTEVARQLGIDSSEVTKVIEEALAVGIDISKEDILRRGEQSDKSSLQRLREGGAAALRPR